MANNRHIIARQIFDVVTGGSIVGFDLQERISQIYWEKVVPPLSDLFDRLAAPDVVIRIDRLEIDLGQIDLSQIESDLTDRLVETMKNQLEQILAARPTHLVQVPMAHSLFETWLYFLENGSLPWSTASISEEELQQATLETVSAEADAVDQLRQLLNDSPRAARRLVIQHSNKFLRQLAEAVSGKTQKKLSLIIDELGKLFHEIGSQSVLNQFIVKKPDHEQVKQEFWLLIVDRLVRKEQPILSPTLVNQVIAKLSAYLTLGALESEVMNLVRTKKDVYPELYLILPKLPSNPGKSIVKSEEEQDEKPRDGMDSWTSKKEGEVEVPSHKIPKINSENLVEGNSKQDGISTQEEVEARDYPFSADLEVIPASDTNSIEAMPSLEVPITPDQTPANTPTVPTLQEAKDDRERISKKETEKPDSLSSDAEEPMVEKSIQEDLITAKVEVPIDQPTDSIRKVDKSTEEPDKEEMSGLKEETLVGVPENEEKEEISQLAQDSNAEESQTEAFLPTNEIEKKSDEKPKQLTPQLEIIPLPTDTSKNPEVDGIAPLEDADKHSPEGNEVVGKEPNVLADNLIEPEDSSIQPSETTTSEVPGLKTETNPSDPEIADIDEVNKEGSKITEVLDQEEKLLAIIDSKDDPNSFLPPSEKQEEGKETPSIVDDVMVPSDRETEAESKRTSEIKPEILQKQEENLVSGKDFKDSSSPRPESLDTQSKEPKEPNLLEPLEYRDKKASITTEAADSHQIESKSEADEFVDHAEAREKKISEQEERQASALENVDESESVQEQIRDKDLSETKPLDAGVLQEPDSGAKKETHSPNPPMAEKGGPLLKSEEDRKESSRTAKNPYSNAFGDKPVGTTYYIRNAGVVLVHAFFNTFFEAIGLVEKKAFVDESSRHKAIHLIEYMASGNTGVPEYNLILPKFLCNLPLEVPMERHVELKEPDLVEVEKLLQALIKHWGALGQSSTDALREGFLQREGKLERRSNDWYLVVESTTIDILLNRLPWNIGIIKLPWMQEMLRVEWG